jgi:hypothetical protein
VNFDHLLVGHAGRLMQIVDVLGDDVRCLAAAHQFGDGTVAGIGRGVREHVLHGETPPPRLATHLGGAQKIVEIDGRHLRPDAAGRTEIGNAGFGRNARAGENHHARHAAQKPGEIFDVAHSGRCVSGGHFRSRPSPNGLHRRS